MNNDNKYFYGSKNFKDDTDNVPKKPVMDYRILLISCFILLGGVIFCVACSMGGAEPGSVAWNNTHGVVPVNNTTNITSVNTSVPVSEPVIPTITDNDVITHGVVIDNTGNKLACEVDGVRVAGGSVVTLSVSFNVNNNYRAHIVKIAGNGDAKYDDYFSKDITKVVVHGKDYTFS
jgi:hypothetical protein